VKQVDATLVTTKEDQQTVMSHDPNHLTVFSLSRQFNNYWITSVVLKIIMYLTLWNLRFTLIIIIIIIIIQNTSYFTANTYPLQSLSSWCSSGVQLIFTIRTTYNTL